MSIGSWVARTQTRVLRILAGSDVKYCPFPGRIEGHPSILLGTVEEIAQDAKQLTALDGVFGLDLLAYRHPERGSTRGRSSRCRSGVRSRDRGRVDRDL